MPELSMLSIALLMLILFVGALLGWFIRADRCGREKLAMNASWQQQIDSRQVEHERLIEQNKGLMQQISQYQTSHKESVLRTKELSQSLQQAVAKGGALQHDIVELKSRLETATSERDELRTEIASRESETARAAEALKKKDSKIFRLSQELENWQNRVPPLVERFRVRDEEAKQVEADLAEAQQTIANLSTVVDPDATRIEAAQADTLPQNLDASNEPHAQTLAGAELPEFEALVRDRDDEQDDDEPFDAEAGDAAEVLASSTATDQEMPTREAGDDEEILASSTAADHETPTSEAGDDEEVLASSTAADQEMPTSEAGDYEKVVASSTAADHETPTSEAGDDEEVLASSTATDHDTPTSEAGDDEEVLASPTAAHGYETAEPEAERALEAEASSTAAHDQATTHPADHGTDVPANDHDSTRERRDDLKQIKGVGPAIEKTLNDLGIYRFHQISEMSEFDIDRVAQRLRGFRSRIYREDWIGQARILLSRRYEDVT